ISYSDRCNNCHGRRYKHKKHIPVASHFCSRCGLGFRYGHLIPCQIHPKKKETLKETVVGIGTKYKFCFPCCNATWKEYDGEPSQDDRTPVGCVRLDTHQWKQSELVPTIQRKQPSY